MSVKSTLDAIDLIAARCRVWAASLFTLLGGAMLVDVFGGFNDLVPKDSKWHHVLAFVTVLVARYTHSKQSATAVIEAKAEQRTTPVTPIGALPSVVLLLLASMTFGACEKSAAAIGAAAPYCQPACNACQRCIQLRAPNGTLLPPVCAPRSPKPAGCP